MTYRTQVVREGELLGPIDWDYDFLQHFRSMGAPEERKIQACEKAKELLRQVEADPSAWRVVMCHSECWRTVHAIGMYDGWPFWKPTPALLLSGTLGCEWHFFYGLREIHPVRGAK